MPNQLCDILGVYVKFLKQNHEGGINDPALRNDAVSMISPCAYLQRVARYTVSIRHRWRPFRCNLPFHIIPLNGFVPLKSSTLVFYNCMSLFSHHSSWMVGRITSAYSFG